MEVLGIYEMAKILLILKPIYSSNVNFVNSTLYIKTEFTKLIGQIKIENQQIN